MSNTILSLASAAALALAGTVAASDPLEGYEPVEQVPVPDPPPAVASEDAAGLAEQGRYLVTLLGCGGCHTDGALAGKPDPQRLLAGSSVGIATSNPMQRRHPGVVFPTNLTPDPETGLGERTVNEIAAALRTGTDGHGDRIQPVMPWMAYSKLTPDDASAIATYLASLPPVMHRVPENVRPGKRTNAPFVHFGVYRSKP